MLDFSFRTALSSHLKRIGGSGRACKPHVAYKVLLGAVLALLTFPATNATAQVCGEGERLFLRTGSLPQMAQEVVGCRMPATAVDCSSLSPTFSERIAGSGACSFCVQDDAVLQHGKSVKPADLIRVGAAGLFGHAGKFPGSFYLADFDCVDDPGWGCVSRPWWGVYNCATCADLDRSTVQLNIGLWPFDENFDNVWNPGSSLTSNQPAFVAGVSGSAIEFTSRDKYVEVPDQGANWLDLIADGNFSVDGWIRTTETRTQALLSKRVHNSESGKWWPLGPGELVAVGAFELPHFRESNLRDISCTCPAEGYCGFQVFTTGGRVGLQIANGTHYNFFPPETSPNAFVADGKWHHFAVTVDRGSKDGITFWVDGEPVRKADGSIFHGNPTRRPGCLSNDASIFIGGQSASSSFGFVGAVDELGVWIEELDAAAIQQIYEAGPAGHCSTLK